MYYPLKFLLLLGLAAQSLRTTNIPKLTPRRIALADGTKFTLNVPEGFGISVAAQGLKRVRFMAKSPDGRIFVTDMYDRTDNRKGTVYILDSFSLAQKKFLSVKPYLKNLRNPNSCAFYTDPITAQSWIYIALTGQLIRYRYNAGGDAPHGEPEDLAAFPDYGLSYKYGGWHLTRTLAFSPRGKLCIAVGSSCNACEEKEDVRAAILETDPDGKNMRFFARGVRNAVGLKFVGDRLFATNMGGDLLGDDKPEDQLLEVRDGGQYGWPYCYQYRGKIYADHSFDTSAKKIPPESVDLGILGFQAHSAPLGLEYFPTINRIDKLDTEKGVITTTPDCLKDCFLVGLHGSSKRSLKRGYRIARVSPGRNAEDFITGFLKGDNVIGRPCDIMRHGDDAFFFTDDYDGLVYYVYAEK